MCMLHLLLPLLHFGCVKQLLQCSRDSIIIQAIWPSEEEPTKMLIYSEGANDFWPDLMENKCGAHSVFICMETTRDATDSYVLNTWLDTVKCQKAEVKTGSRSPHRLSEHIDLFKIWLSESMSKNSTFPQTLECTAAFLSWHWKACSWPVRRAAGHQAGVPTCFKQTPMCLIICGLSAGFQVRRTYCSIVRSNERHPPCGWIMPGKGVQDPHVT